MNAAQIEVLLAREGLSGHDMEAANYAPNEGSCVRMGDEGEYDIFDQMQGGDDLSHLIEGLPFEAALAVLDRLGIDYEHLLNLEEVPAHPDEPAPVSSFAGLFKR
jgi:hypothetical protein